MISRLKIVFYYLIEFIVSVMLVGIFGLLIANITIYSPKYMRKTFVQIGFYNNVYTAIMEKSTDNIIPAGLPESILDDFISKQQVKDDIDKVVDAVYSGEEIVVDGGKVREELATRINAYMKEHNIEVTDEQSLIRLLDQIEGIYTREISMSKIFPMMQKIITKTDRYIKLGLVILIVTVLILICIVRFGFKLNACSIPLLTGSLILLYVCYFINSNITIANITIWNDNVSVLIQTVLYTVIRYMKTIAFLCLPVGCVDIYTEKYLKQGKKK